MAAPKQTNHPPLLPFIINIPLENMRLKTYKRYGKGERRDEKSKSKVSSDKSNKMTMSNSQWTMEK
jgi:hypothetical protein